MKNRIIILSLLISLTLLIQASGKPEGTPGIVENIAASVRSGNSKSLATFFSSTVEITLPGKEGTFSKVQAEMVMKDFFARNTPLSFIVDQKGASAGGSQFMIGTYKSSNRVYKTYFLLKPADNKLLIQQIQFEAD